MALADVLRSTAFSRASLTATGTLGSFNLPGHHAFLPLGLACGNTALWWRLPKSDPLQAVCLVLTITGKESNAINLYYISILHLYLKFHTRARIENVCTSDVLEYEILQDL